MARIATWFSEDRRPQHPPDPRYRLGIGRQVGGRAGVRGRAPVLSALRRQMDHQVPRLRDPCPRHRGRAAGRSAHRAPRVQAQRTDMTLRPPLGEASRSALAMLKARCPSGAAIQSGSGRPACVRRSGGADRSAEPLSEPLPARPPQICAAPADHRSRRIGANRRTSKRPKRRDYLDVAIVAARRRHEDAEPDISTERLFAMVETDTGARAASVSRTHTRNDSFHRCRQRGFQRRQA